MFENVVYTPALARGFEYYSDLIYELHADGFSGSILGGGIYKIKDYTLMVLEWV